MALTVRPDDEVYQFDTVWLGPDEYTLPIQARYVAWGTWLACFLVAAVLLIPLGGGGPAGVLGSLIWALGLSVVLSRAIMLVVDHERPLRSLPALFSAEARAALQGRRRGERSLLIRPDRVRVRQTPAKVLAMRERQRSRAAAKAARKHGPGAELAAEIPAQVAAEAAVPVRDEPARTPDSAVDGWPARHTPAWSIRADEHDLYEPDPVPVPVEDDEVRGFVRAPDPEARPPIPTAGPAVAREPAAVPASATALGGPAPAPPAAGPFRAEPHDAEPDRTAANGGATARERRREAVDPHAALEARILLPARKDR